MAGPWTTKWFHLVVYMAGQTFSLLLFEDWNLLSRHALWLHHQQCDPVQAAINTASNPATGLARRETENKRRAYRRSKSNLSNSDHRESRTKYSLISTGLFTVQANPSSPGDRTPKYIITRVVATSREERIFPTSASVMTCTGDSNIQAFPCVKPSFRWNPVSLVAW